MSRLESGHIWHEMNKKFQDKYHQEHFVSRFRYGFDVRLLTEAELNQYVMVYTAVMTARGYHQSTSNKFELYKRDILESNLKN